MNRKLKKYLDSAERIEKRIAELEEQLKAVRSAKELEENKEMVKSIREMGLSGRELFSLLCGLQDGSVTFRKTEDGGRPSQESADGDRRLLEKKGKKEASRKNGNGSGDSQKNWDAAGTAEDPETGTNPAGDRKAPEDHTLASRETQSEESEEKDHETDQNA